MSTINLKAQTTLFYSTNCFLHEPAQHFLKLSANNSIYLFFYLPPWLDNWSIQKARLILYKHPYSTCNADCSTSLGKYILVPLLEPFNVCGCTECFPDVDFKYLTTYSDSYKNYAEIDITKIVQAWHNNTLENDGILLMGNRRAPVIFYASNQHCLSQMHPVIRLNCTNIKVPLSLQSADCSVYISRRYSTIK